MIPVISTTSYCMGNPGDLFIFWGFQHLMHETFEKILPWYVFSKFTPNQFKNNIDVLKKYKNITYVGTPQYNNYDNWIEWYDWDLWKEIIIPCKLDFRTVAGGAGIPEVGIGVKEFVEFCNKSTKTKSILNSKRIRTKYTTVRDKYANALLTANNWHNQLFPCTASWSTKFLNLQKKATDYSIIVPPSPNIVHERISGGNSKEFIVNKYLDIYFLQKQMNMRPLFVFHDKETYDIFPSDVNKFYTKDALSLLKIYENTKYLISGRIYAAIPVYAMGNTQVVSLPIDTRGAAVEELSIPNISMHKSAEEIVDILLKSEPLDKVWFAKVTDEYKASLYEGFKDVVK